MIQKAIIILLLSCTGGAGFFLGGAEVGDGFDFFNSEVGPVTKKKNLVKPKSFYSKRRIQVSDFDYDQLSFFPILNDSSLNTMMGLNGQVITKTSYSPPPVRVAPPEKKIQKKPPAPVAEVVPARFETASLKTAPTTPASPKKVWVAPQEKSSRQRSEPPVNPRRAITGSSGTPLTGGEELNKKRTVQTLSPENPSRGNIGSSGTLVSYVVQVGSFRQWQRAEVFRSALEKKGYASFIGKTELPGNKGTWYRVNIGAYLDHTGAKRAAMKYYRKENQKAMVTRQSG